MLVSNIPSFTDKESLVWRALSGIIEKE